MWAGDARRYEEKPRIVWMLEEFVHPSILVEPYGFFPSSDSTDMQRRYAFAYAVLEASGSGRVTLHKEFSANLFQHEKLCILR
jgi:hypothetical protein